MHNDDLINLFISREAADIRRSLREAEDEIGIPTRASVLKYIAFKTNYFL